MSKHRPSLLILLCCLFFSRPALADDELRVPWPGDWRVEAAAASVERYQGRDALALQNGRVWLDEAPLRDGVVRFALNAGAELGFYGIAFRAVDAENYEHIYVRPFLSGNPDATQYTPVYNGVSGWQLYADERFAVAAPVATDRWATVEVAFRDRYAVLSIDGERVFFPALQRAAAAGGLAITASGATVRIADVSVSREPPDIGGTATGAAAEPDAHSDDDGDVIDTFMVSTTFGEYRLDPAAPLPAALTGALEWAKAGTDVRGIVNLAKTRRRSADANTVLAGVTLRSADERSVRLRFGFSDRVIVYLDGRPLYRGRNEWRSRDYRFLGTVGRFDEVILPLSPGDNVLRFAVSETFGGWGITAALVDAAGVEVIARQESAP